MDRETLSNYGWVVIVVIVLAIMIALATPFGNYIADGTKAILTKFSQDANIDVSFGDSGSGEDEATIEMLEGDGQVVNTYAFAPLSFRSAGPIDTFQEVKVDGVTVDPSNYTVTEGSTIVTFNADYTKQLGNGTHDVKIVHDDGFAAATMNVDASNTIPEGATYTDYINSYYDYENRQFYYDDVVVYHAGDSFPETPSYGDVYSPEGDFVYAYSCCMVFGNWEPIGAFEDFDVWSVGIKATNKTSYSGKILENVGPWPVTNMDYIFMSSCYETVDMSGIIIPNSIKTMNSAFSGCTNLVSAPVIPSSVEEMDFAFESCEKLTSVTINATPTLYNGGIFTNTLIKDVSCILGDCENKEALIATSSWDN